MLCVTVNSSIVVGKLSVFGAYIKGHYLGKVLPDFMPWADFMPLLLYTLGTFPCVTCLSVWPPLFSMSL